MRAERLLGWIALVFAGLILSSGVAMYFINPFHTSSDDPRARVLGFTAFRQPSASMEPTIHLGAIFIVNVATLRDRDPKPGEIIVFRYPPDPHIAYVKRVIADGGSDIEMRDGVVYVNGKAIAELYLPAKPIQEDMNADFERIHVPEGEFFVLGDNRGNSSDSRLWGTVRRDLVIGVHTP